MKKLAICMSVVLSVLLVGMAFSAISTVNAEVVEERGAWIDSGVSWGFISGGKFYNVVWSAERGASSPTRTEGPMYVAPYADGQIPPYAWNGDSYTSPTTYGPFTSIGMYAESQFYDPNVGYFWLP